MRCHRRIERFVRALGIVMASVVALSVWGFSVAGCGYLAARKVSYGPVVKDGQVLFRYYAPSARRVQLAGSWPENNWARGDGSVGEANIGLMDDKNGDGIWEIAVALQPGRYEYVFWVDENTWHLDPGNPEEVSGGPGGTCSQVVLYSAGGSLEIR